MKRARILVLAIAGVAAGAAAILANGFLSKPTIKTVEKNINTTNVLVAKTDLELGRVIKAGDLSWQPWPKEAANSPGYITQEARAGAMQDLVGSIARVPFMAGEPIKETKLVKANQGGVMAAILPQGMRAISTKIDPASAVGGFVLPNDRVDVIVTRKLRGSGNRSGEQVISDTLFRNVRVLAIGQEIEVKDGKKVATGSTATLELTPAQAETLALAKTMAGSGGPNGEISLTLRSLADSTSASSLTPEGGESFNKPEQSTGVRMLRYGMWTRSYGSQ